MDKEYIGKVCLDLSMYSGRDLYSDGDVEDELIQIVKDNDEASFRDIIEKNTKWPILYHLSVQRGNIVEWLPLEGKKVLEVGSGCGAVTGVLSEKADSVTCIELSKKRSMINAYRHKEKENIEIHVGNFQDIEDKLDRDFDYIMLIGVLEYADSYIGGSRPQEQFLKCLKSHLKADGTIVVAIENRYGLKYFAGAGEDHTGRYFDGIENYPVRKGVRTFGIEGLKRIAGNAGFEKISEYYPYPDYKFTGMIFSPRRLPEKGELKNNICNYDRERMLIFDETKAFDGIAEDGNFRTFSNSYLLLLNGESDVDYIKYSSDRAPEYAISTRICHDGAGLRVEKRPLYKEGAAHIKKLIERRELLEKQYAASGLEINKGRLEYEGDMPVAVFEYLDGKNLESRVERRLSEGSEDAFCELFEEYLKRITPSDVKAPVCRDMIFSNIICDNDRWTLIDYEWTDKDGGTPEEAALRTLYCYGLEHPG
ncbi:MAG: class I SAM-dependent methyltransferase, partial [Lachnospiraceae bacterium]|nr:class I SAM-dependent methyltransferase [Lachnospiraceae bacterium]